MAIEELKTATTVNEAKTAVNSLTKRKELMTELDEMKDKEKKALLKKVAGWLKELKDDVKGVFGKERKDRKSFSEADKQAAALTYTHEKLSNDDTGGNFDNIKTEGAAGESDAGDRESTFRKEVDTNAESTDDPKTPFTEAQAKEKITALTLPAGYTLTFENLTDGDKNGFTATIKQEDAEGTPAVKFDKAGKAEEQTITINGKKYTVSSDGSAVTVEEKKGTPEPETITNTFDALEVLKERIFKTADGVLTVELTDTDGTATVMVGAEGFIFNDGSGTALTTPTSLMAKIGGTATDQYLKISGTVGAKNYSKSILKNGAFYETELDKENKMTGQGRYLYEKGRQENNYSGIFKNSKYEGKGILTFNDLGSLNGEFEEDAFVSGEYIVKDTDASGTVTKKQKAILSEGAIIYNAERKTYTIDPDKITEITKEDGTTLTETNLTIFKKKLTDKTLAGLDAALKNLEKESPKEKKEEKEKGRLGVFKVEQLGTEDKGREINLPSNAKFDLLTAGAHYNESDARDPMNLFTKTTDGYFPDITKIQSYYEKKGQKVQMIMAGPMHQKTSEKTITGFCQESGYSGTKLGSDDDLTGSKTVNKGLLVFGTDGKARLTHTSEDPKYVITDDVISLPSFKRGGKINIDPLVSEDSSYGHYIVQKDSEIKLAFVKNTNADDKKTLLDKYDRVLHCDVMGDGSLNGYWINNGSGLVYGRTDGTNDLIRGGTTETPRTEGSMPGLIVVTTTI